MPLNFGILGNPPHADNGIAVTADSRWLGGGGTVEGGVGLPVDHLALPAETVVIGTQLIPSDVNDRFKLMADGDLIWGNGAGTFDISISRINPGEMAFVGNWFSFTTGAEFGDGISVNGGGDFSGFVTVDSLASSGTITAFANIHSPTASFGWGDAVLPSTALVVGGTGDALVVHGDLTLLDSGDITIQSGNLYVAGEATVANSLTIVNGSIALTSTIGLGQVNAAGAITSNAQIQSTRAAGLNVWEGYLAGVGISSNITSGGGIELHPRTTGTNPIRAWDQVGSETFRVDSGANVSVVDTSLWIQWADNASTHWFTQVRLTRGVDIKNGLADTNYFLRVV